ncbi:Plant self-incompatibility S1 [Arabidopsis thaliana x Arabidopsis arenosa]|uniref:S-protein homolog n=5 Tax=Arabidopsis TaxID=3701 RepID=F4IV52_ARATH|nr:Plant self-incompatibility protein S1 family [Arabidopsis thaliana]AEC05800.1 Plant self-incompatibility protein S1 family [Arabidopsis thaliana]KAG7635822.1 Plant self-incompatibility S1 [Arabidopsis thaliana x Arabidopsis arenosa]KAG7640470.1 Plant self-incompatibility S1 [Arabidopsis suecica]|eukprot:NP_001189509.1 Plant self-incompatibility protein S1 family [Arabidopsis thaliana]
MASLLKTVILDLRKMNHLIIFTLVIAIHFSFNEACNTPNVVEIHNQLAPGKLLKHHCRGSINEQDKGVQYLKVNQNFTIVFSDVSNRRERTVWTCMLNHGDKMEFHFNLQVYRAAATERCNQYRSWTAKPDGIWFRRDRNKPSGHVRNWMR